MFIYNIKINSSKIFKLFLGLIIFVFLIITLYIIYTLFSGANSEGTVNDDTKNHIFKIEAKNYTNVLKAVHDNVDDYVGTKINFTGYVYRIYDLSDTQFILARNMIVSSDNNYVIVGFLCEYANATSFNDGVWVDVTGEITKGDYHGEMPIIKITNMVLTSSPSSDEFVYPPDDDYIPTNSML